MAFLHGSETVEVQTSGGTIVLAKNSIVGLVGTAPVGGVGELVAISTLKQGIEVYGEQVPGFTIPQSLAAHFAQGGGTIVVLNVFDISTMATSVPGASLVISGGKAKMAAAPVDTPAFTNAGATVTFVAGTDYKVDSFGNFTVLNFTAIPEGSTVLATYKFLSPTSGVTAAAAVIGSVTNGVRTGFKKLVESRNLFGYIPKILISPTFCENAGVAAEMIVQATALEGVAIIDAPETATVTTAITARGPSGTFAGFKSSSDRVILTFPYLKVFDVATNDDQNRPYSPFLAGVISANEKYWESPSNKEILGITGVSQLVTSAINDASTDANKLNEVGIVTVFGGYGTGTRTWGNRNASFPSTANAESFIATRLVKDSVHASLEEGILAWIDKPINQAFVDGVTNVANKFINTQQARSALTPGSFAKYNPSSNTVAQLENGHVVFDVYFANPIPAERITFQSKFDVNLIKAALT